MFVHWGFILNLGAMEDRLVFKGLPEKSPDPYASVAVIKMEFESEVRQVLGAGYVVL
jgi:hypothetical protein